jgi:hypothetical protein
MEYNNGLVFIEIKSNILNHKNTEKLQDMMKEYAEYLADFVDLCVGMQPKDEYMSETPLGHQIDGE